MKDPQTTVGKMADTQKTAFVGSIDTEGFPNVKAMLQPRLREGIRVFYFTSNTGSMRVRQWRRDARACVYFCDRRHFRGVMLRGRMEVLTDQRHRALIWREGDTEYYPEGVNDPDYCVLKFTAASGRYYCGFKSEDFQIE